jgi:hypothetical protein
MAFSCPTSSWLSPSVGSLWTRMASSSSRVAPRRTGSNVMKLFTFVFTNVFDKLVRFLLASLSSLVYCVLSLF